MSTSHGTRMNNAGHVTEYDVTQAMTPPLYAADMPDRSLFDLSAKPWDLRTHPPPYPLTEELSLTIVGSIGFPNRSFE